MKFPTAFVAFALSAPAQAQALEDLSALDARLAEHGALQPLDRRLRLTRCPEAVVIDPPTLGAVAVRCVALGWRIRVPVVQAAAAAQDVLVKKGDLVDLTYSGEAYSISTTATAVEFGVRGQKVRVTSAVSGKAVSATVTGPGEVSAVP
jgi:flagellar basal body P-ring formation protein FlgA